MNSEFSFSLTSCLTKAEEPSLPYYLPIAGERIIGFTPYPRVLVLCEMQSVSSRIWTCVDVSISYDDNHYTTGTSINKNLSGANNLCKSGPGSYGNERILRISQRSRITETSSSVFFESYLGHSLGDFYPSAEKQSVYSSAQSTGHSKYFNSNYIYIYIYI